MSQANPKWWQLYLVFPLLMVLFAAENRFKISARGHQLVQIGIVLVIFGLIRLWLKANSTALLRVDQRQYRKTFTIIEMPPSQPAEFKRILQLPDSEIKGVLSDTFEMDYTQADSSPVEDYRRN